MDENIATLFQRPSGHETFAKQKFDVKAFQRLFLTRAIRPVFKVPFYLSSGLFDLLLEAHAALLHNLETITAGLASDLVAADSRLATLRRFRFEELCFSNQRNRT